ncbi:hypothetical protein B0H19DRAFT_1377914 [Mycena capillaripes]|nr:hypothetical protein B0H19DRAFT_1377914 [Mycena capillaripes]
MPNWSPRYLAAKVRHFRLGYSIQRPYPGRWTTLIVCIVYFAITVLLVLINIPLTAYDIVETFTYTPNETAAALPFSFLVPSLRRHSAGDFRPQTFEIGDSLRTNLSMFDYQISAAFTKENQPIEFGDPVTLGIPVVSFVWSNNPLSSCDVFGITISLRKDERVVIGASVGCWMPATYSMNMALNHQSLQDRTGGFLEVLMTLDALLVDLEHSWNHEITVFTDGGLLPDPTNVTGMDVSVYPCCLCTGIGPEYESNRASYVPTDDNGIIGRLPCDTTTARFKGTSVQLRYPSAGGGYSYASMDFGDVEILPSTSVAELQVAPNLRAAIMNAFQAIFHAVRLDLGVIGDNQIYTSSAMYDQSISPLPSNGTRFGAEGPSPVLRGGQYNDQGPYTERTRERRLDAAVYIIPQLDVATSFLNLFHGDDFILLITHGVLRTVRVPSVAYLRPVFRQKPLASAAASVFVSTFAMVSVLWKLFSLFAAVAVSDKETPHACTHCHHCQSGSSIGVQKEL